MNKSLKTHFDKKKALTHFNKVRADSTFVIRIQDGFYHHSFIIKITPECNIHTKFIIQSKLTKPVFDFIMKFDNDLIDNVYIPIRDRYVMLVLNNQVEWIGFSPHHPLTLSLYQAEKLVNQLYELKLECFNKRN